MRLHSLKLCFLLTTFFLTKSVLSIRHDFFQQNNLSIKSEKFGGFVENLGQMMDINGNPAQDVLFASYSANMNLWITKSGIVFEVVKIEEEASENISQENIFNRHEEEEFKINSEIIELILNNGEIKRENIEKLNPFEGSKNFFYPHCRDGIYGVKEYGALVIKNVYEKIDWVLYFTEDRQFKYDFVIHPGGDYKAIELLYRSKKPLKINKMGELEVNTMMGLFKEASPESFIGNSTIKTNFIIQRQHSRLFNNDKGFETFVKFEPEGLKKNPDKKLIIDPQIIWSTFFGGSQLDGPQCIDVDANGNVYVAGYVTSANFPLVNTDSYFQKTYAGTGDVLIMKFDNTGKLLWSTFYGGTLTDVSTSIVFDKNGYIYLTGYTKSNNFPVLQKPGSFFQANKGSDWDAFILQFSTNGTLVWSTFLGGNAEERAYSIDVDNNGNIFIAGSTYSTDLPVNSIPGYPQSAHAGNTDIFVFKFDNNGTKLWGSYYGGINDESAFSIECDQFGNLLVAGYTNSPGLYTKNMGNFYQDTLSGGDDALILKFSPSGNILWATYFGGSADDYARSLKIGLSQEIYIEGLTTSNDFPLKSSGSFIDSTLNGGQDIFFVKFSANSQLVWSTYFGGNNKEWISSFRTIAIDQCGRVYFSFNTNSQDVPLKDVCLSFIDSTFDGTRDIVIASFDRYDYFLWSSYIGGDGFDFRESIVMDQNDNLYITGEWVNAKDTNTYPLKNPGNGAFYDNTPNGKDDGFILKLYFPKDVIQATCNGPVCEGQNLELNASLVYNHACSVMWTGPASFNSGSLTISIQNASLQDSGVYLVMSREFCAYDTVHVIVHQNPLASINAIDTVCEGQNIVLSGQGGSFYEWSGPNNFFSQSQQIFLNNVNLKNAGGYMLIVTDSNTCSDTAYQNITVFPKPVANFSANDVCLGLPSSFVDFSSVSSGNITQWNWNFNPGSSNLQNPSNTFANHGAYNVQLIVTTDNNCSDTVTKTVNVWPLPMPDFSAPDVCLGVTTPFSANVSIPSGSITAYAWNFGDNSSASGSSVTHTYAADGTYNVKLTATSDKGCVDSITKPVNVWPLPVVDFFADTTNGCSPVCVNFSANVSISSGTINAYLWNLGNGSNASSPNPSACYENTAASPKSFSVSLSATSDKGCASSITKNNFVMVFPNALADFYFSPDQQSIFSPDFQFYNQSFAANQFVWNFGDGSTSNLPNPTHSYNDTGTYTITLLANNAWGCADTIAKSLRVLPEFAIYVPNAFTPDGDKHNNTWKVYGFGIKNITIYVFNRWGELIWQTDNIHLSWDGMVNNIAAPTGVYPYRIIVETYKGYVCEYFGSVHLIR